MKTILKLLLFILLLALPFGVRYWLYFGQPSDGYQPPAIVTPDVTALLAEPLTYQSYADQPKPGDGRVLVDMAHDNNLLVDDLTPLQERLAARGVSIRLYDYDSDYLSEELRSVTAFVVIAPTRPFYLEEIRAVEEFVAQGGLLLLAADPTRSVPAYDSYGYVDLYSLFFPESAVPAVNSLANRFGMQFFEDYLYNLKDYQVNFRNVKITNFASSPLTAGLDEMIVFAAHSVQSDGTALLTGNADTLSNVRTGETALAVAALSADERVLALGDLTLLTAPSHRAADNDRFLSNLADWLAQDGRTWRLEDFPYLFTQPIELIAVSEQALQPAVLNVAGPLQQALSLAGKTLSWSQTPSVGSDHILAGLFDETAPISDVLASAGISITLVTEPADSVDENADESVDESDEDAEPTKDTEGEATPEDTPEEPAVSTVTVEGMGEFTLDGLQLFLVDRRAGSTSLTILASDRDGLALAVQRLLYRDFSGCATQAALTLCAADAYAIWEEPTPTPEAPSETTSERIFILSIDNGFGFSSADAWLTALGEDFDVTVWSISENGVPAEEDLAGYDAYILDTSDYAYDSALMEQLPTYVVEGSFLLIGEQPVDPTLYQTDALLDIEVADPAHPLATDLPAGEPIVLSESYSGVPAVIFEDLSEPMAEMSVVFTRGPQSSAAQSPVLQAYDFTAEEDGSRFAFALFAFYRLPEELQPTFALNVVNWLLGH
jgi:hypothetical protein